MSDCVAGQSVRGEHTWAVRRRQRPSPLSNFAEGEKWLASATKISSVGLRTVSLRLCLYRYVSSDSISVLVGKRDVIHDELFFVCFSEVCQTAIHTQLQLQRRRGGSDAPQRTRSRSAPLISEVAPLQGSESPLRPVHTDREKEETERESAQTEREREEAQSARAQTQLARGVVDETEEATAPAASAWVPPHRRARKVSFAGSAQPAGILQ